MSSLEPVPPLDKEQSQTLVDSIRREKSMRVTREGLRNLMLFHNALETELKKLKADNNAQAHSKLIGKMTAVQEKYIYAMSGLSALDDDAERHAFISLADAIQDLMAYMHLRRH